jgi:hypothetical protein
MSINPYAVAAATRRPANNLGSAIAILAALGDIASGSRHNEIYSRSKRKPQYRPQLQLGTALLRRLENWVFPLSLFFHFILFRV